LVKNLNRFVSDNQFAWLKRLTVIHYKLTQLRVLDYPKASFRTIGRAYFSSNVLINMQCTLLAIANMQTKDGWRIVAGGSSGDLFVFHEREVLIYVRSRIHDNKHNAYDVDKVVSSAEGAHNGPILALAEGWFADNSDSILPLSYELSAFISC
jgi:hypothetical protein